MSAKDSEPKGKICNDVCARIMYQIALTVLIVGTILLVILIFQVLMPFLKVSKYHWTSCLVVNATMANDPLCELEAAFTKKVCVTAKSKSAPCLQIYVKYNDSIGGHHAALLHHNEYNVLKDKYCTYHAVNTYEWQNIMYAERFEHSYGKVGSNYSCLWDPDDDTHVIVEKYHSQQQVMHIIMWPSIGIFLSVLIIGGCYCSVGCGVDVWGDHITTVMWETNLKDLEYDAQMRRINVMREKEARYNHQDNNRVNRGFTQA